MMRAVRAVTRVQPFRRSISVDKMGLLKPLSEVDPEMHAIIEAEKHRQLTSICLTASENFAPKAVMETVGSIMTNKYSEGYPGARYYGGNKFIDQSERLCQARALKAFNVDTKDWGVNVQGMSGSPANFCVYAGILEPFDRIMALDLPHGGHLSHGYQVNTAAGTKKVSSVSKFFTSMPYRLNEEMGLIDYEECEKFAVRYRPKLLIAGASAYPRDYDYKRMRDIANKSGSILMADMAHISGLVATGEHPSPFDYCDVVTTTTHKLLRGPRGALIFFRRGEGLDFEEKINAAVFPGMQGGPHNHTIAGIAVALTQAGSPEFKEYTQQVKRNAQALADSLLEQSYDLVSGGTDNHLVLVNLRSKGLNGNKGERACELANIAMNKNTVPGDTSALAPSGLRFGTPAMTSRGLMEKDFREVGQFVGRSLEIALRVQGKVGKKLKDFNPAIAADPEMHALKKEVEAFASQFPAIV